MSSLSLYDVAIGYGVKVVASGISADIEPGQLMCLIGKNGSGKSTLFKTIACFLPALAGKITIDGRDISEMKRSEMAQMVGVVLTERPESQEMSVWEMVAMGRSPYTGFFGNMNAHDREVVQEAIDRVGIATLAERKVSTLSDGERQKVMIAKALAQQTPVILLDEPTAFLDFPSKVELMQMLQNLARSEKKVILLSTHDLPIAFDMADMVWMFNEDEQPTRLQVLTPPISRETVAAFVGQAASKYIL
ncbi:MAG: ABC transporter ATP-binding protein [Prevotellaceae bacterium]|nr:ABC transporter ATP-binding protein [Prevotellaceae bacterium]